MNETQIANLCALYGCVAKRTQLYGTSRYVVFTHDGRYVIDWSFETHSIEWYARELANAVRRAREELKEEPTP